MRYPYIPRSVATLLPEDMCSLFYWMPKTAGTSMRDALRGHFGSAFVMHDLQFGGRSNPAVFNPDLKCATFWHSHIPALVKSGYIKAEWVASMFGFAFVRNPWDRMVSLFHYLRRTSFQIELPSTFERFLEVVVGGECPRPGFKSTLGYYQTNSLLDWLRPDGVWLPQFVGKFETLYEDWDTLSIILGLPPCLLPHCNASLHAPFREYYDARLEALVAAYFAEEIDVFEYTFKVR